MGGSLPSSNAGGAVAQQHIYVSVVIVFAIYVTRRGLLLEVGYLHARHVPALASVRWAGVTTMAALALLGARAAYQRLPMGQHIRGYLE